MEELRISASKKVAAALACLGFVEVDDYAAITIAKAELRDVGDEIMGLSEQADTPNAKAVQELATRLNKIADAFGEME